LRSAHAQADVEVFLFMMSQLCFYKMPHKHAAIVAVLCGVTGVCVAGLARRAMSLFPLSKAAGFATSRHLRGLAAAVDARNRGDSGRQDGADGATSQLEGRGSGDDREPRGASQEVGADSGLQPDRGAQARAAVNPLARPGVVKAALELEEPRGPPPPLSTANRLLRRIRKGGVGEQKSDNPTDL
jgi:hypothetical protein